MQNQFKKNSFFCSQLSLVKTALAGNDPNWGRIVMGIGKSGEKIDKDKITIKYGDFIVAQDGSPNENIDIEKLNEYMQWDSYILKLI